MQKIFNSYPILDSTAKKYLLLNTKLLEKSTEKNSKSSKKLLKPSPKMKSTFLKKMAKSPSWDKNAYLTLTFMSKSDKNPKMLNKMK